MHIVNIILQFLAAALIVLGIVLLFSAKTLRPLLRQAWQIVWKKKYLWFVGIFAGFVAYGGEVNFLVRKVLDVASFREVITAIRDVVSNGQADNLLTLLRQGFSSSPFLIISYIFLALLMVAIVYWLIIISQGAIMRLTGRMAMNQPTSFADAISTASGKLWELVKVAVIFLLVGWGAWLILAGLPTMIYFLSGQGAWANVAELGSYASMLVSFVNLFLIQYATAAIVLLDKSAVDAIVLAWHIFRRNYLITFELALVLFAANLIILVLVAALLTFFFPTPTPTGFYITVAVLVVELGVMSAWSYAATNGLFVWLLKDTPVGKLGQWTEKIVNLATAKKTA